MPVETGDAKTLEQRLRLIEDRFEIYDLIASHPPSADTGNGNYTASVWTEDGVFDRGADSRGRPDARRSPAALRTPSTTVRSSKGSRISPACPMCGSPATRRLRSLICRSSCPTMSVRNSMSPIMARRVASTCIAFGQSLGVRPHRRGLEDQAPDLAPTGRDPAGARDIGRRAGALECDPLGCQ